MALLEVRQIGSWPLLKVLMRDKNARLEAQRIKIVRDFVEEFRRVVEGQLPKTPDMDLYRESIVERELVGAYDKRTKEFAYALVAEGRKMDLMSIDEDTHVVYVLPTKEPTPQLGVLLIEHSPWVRRYMDTDRLQHLDGVKYVHRRVSPEEVEKVARKNEQAISEHSKDFAAAHALNLDKEKPQPPKSVPDLAFLAMRMEFGIGMPMIPHWHYAAQRAKLILKGMFSNEKKYTRYINDPRFTQWRKPEKKLKPMPIQRFVKRFKEFQDKVKVE